MKNKRFSLESDIITHVYEDNKNTVHFNYRVDIDGDNTVTLELFTFNKRTNSVFLLHRTKGENSIKALSEMYDYINAEKHDMSPYLVTWSKNDEDETHVSYFWESSKTDVYNKFFYNKKVEDYKIDIELRPLS